MQRYEPGSLTQFPRQRKLPRPNGVVMLPGLPYSSHSSTSLQVLPVYKEKTDFTQNVFSKLDFIYHYLTLLNTATIIAYHQELIYILVYSGNDMIPIDWCISVGKHPLSIHQHLYKTVDEFHLKIVIIFCHFARICMEHIRKIYVG